MAFFLITMVEYIPKPYCEYEGPCSLGFKEPSSTGSGAAEGRRSLREVWALRP